VRVLIAHSRYLSGSVSGENRVVEDEAALLQSGGHTVRLWDPSVSKAGGVRQMTRVALDTIWSRDRALQMRTLISEADIQLVHVHNLFPALSPAVIRVASEADVPIVMTLHNFRMMCLPAVLLRDGHVCEDCVGKVPWRGIVHRCYRGSRPASAVLASSITLHKALGTFSMPHRYLAVSDFVRQKHIEAGLDPNKIEVKSNFVWPGLRRKGPGEYLLFLGRVSSEKGVRTLIEAAKLLEARVMIVGDGPEETQLKRNAPSGVEFQVSVSPEGAAHLLAHARALVVPSICYEGQPRSILEAFAAGVPVVASRIGGLPELVEDGVNGLLVPPGDAKALADACSSLSDSSSVRMGQAAFERWQRDFSPTRGLDALLSSYRAAVHPA
jgi:glycosyltransferase involved in cell wall biosynthesis